ncbi:MAG: hypothetical protein HYU64_07560 [Armatimonadetes bacterium]|nr:hypothetical protein [Armatimonadota bacterium]
MSIIPRCLTALLGILLLLSISASAAKSKIIDVFFAKDHWQVVLDKAERLLLCVGPGYGAWADEAVIVARQVDDAWAAGSQNGPVIIYRSGVIMYRWVILKHSTGRKIAGGLLLYTNPGTGNVTKVKIKDTEHGAEITLDFERAPQATYVIDVWGHSSPKGAEMPRSAPTPAKTEKI